jgi:hypothetical protein
MDITMSTFKEYLSESVKTYEFKIKIAGDLPEGFDKAMKTALMKYDCSSISKGKRIPIQEAPLDFPEMKNTHVTIFDVSCRYPATPQTLTEYLVDQLKIARGGIRVRNTREQENIDDNVEAMNRIGTSTEAILNKPYETESAQDQVGGKKVLNFLKELGKISHKGEQVKGVNDDILAKSSPEEKSATNSDNMGTTSPIGSNKADPFKGQKK